MVVGGIYTSTNSGATWTKTGAPPLSWWSVASSADATKLVVVADSGGIYTSTDAGVIWTQSTAPNSAWQSVASSADGTNLVATDYGGHVFASTDAGATWAQRNAPGSLPTYITSSPDGTNWAAVVRALGIYTSTDGGATWSQTAAPTDWWSSIASSADGRELVAGAQGVGSYKGGLYTSTDAGATWTEANLLNRTWLNVVSSADGTKLVAGAYGGGIWTAQATIAPTITNQPGSATVSTADNVTFSVGVSGTPPFTFSWTFDGTKIDGATNATLTLSNVTSAAIGSYAVTISNVAGSVTSEPATLASVDITMFGMFAGIVVNGPLGSNYLIQTTSNLMSSWTTLMNVPLETQPYLFIDYGSPTNSQQYYRVLPQ